MKRRATFQRPGGAMSPRFAIFVSALGMVGFLWPAAIRAQNVQLGYSTYLGGGSTDIGRGVAVDADACAYVGGYTESGDFPTANACQTSGRGSSDLFVSKLSSSGSSLLYSTYIGGSQEDDGFDLCLGSAREIYLTGRTWSSDFPTVAPYQTSGSGGGDGDAFACRLSSSGSFLAYSTYLGGGDIDGGNGISVNSSGQACLTGYTKSADFPTKNPYQARIAGNYDAFISRLSFSGSALIYSTYFGGTGNDFGQGVSPDSAGRVSVTGRTDSLNFPTRNSFQASCAGWSDVFMARHQNSWVTGGAGRLPSA